MWRPGRAPGWRTTLIALQNRDIPPKCKISLYLWTPDGTWGEKLGRIWGLAALAVGIWLLAAYGQHRPAPLGLDAPATQFSAARADAVMARLLDGQQPRPAGSAQNAALRAHLMEELARLGATARTQTGLSCAARSGFVTCGTVTNVIADIAPGRGTPLLLLAHMDSVAAGPGAGDDMSGVATILETVRALKARGLPRHRPIRALFTDGEESGLLGAIADLREPAARPDVVINMEARGNRGPSYLFQTSPGDAPLVDIYARSVSHVAASSFYAEIYKVLPNDTDLTPFLRAGITGYNFAFIGNAAHYHTPLDRRENLDPASLQHHGENLLGLADALSRADDAALKGGDAIYMDVLGWWLPRLPQAWALPLSVLAFGMIAVAGLMTRRARHTLSRPVLAGMMPPLLVLGCIGMGFALHGLAAWLSGHADPSYAHPVYLRISLGFGAFFVALLAARHAGGVAAWLWLAAMAIACALLAPGVTPYFLFPALVAAPLLLMTVRGGRGAALFVSALAALLVWLPLAQGLEPAMGLKMHPLFMVPVALALVTVLPLLTKARGLGVSAVVALLIAIGLAVTAGLQPPFSEAAPQRLNLRYAEMDGKAVWMADPVERLPPALRAVADFSATPQMLVERAYIAPAGKARFPAPRASVSRDGNRVTLALDAPGDGVLLVVPPDAGLRHVSINGAAVTPAAQDGRVMVMCGTPDCGRARVALELDDSRALSLTLISLSRGLPPESAVLVKARGALAVPSQMGDRTLRAVTIRVPGA